MSMADFNPGFSFDIVNEETVSPWEFSGELLLSSDKFLFPHACTVSRSCNFS